MQIVHLVHVGQILYTVCRVWPISSSTYSQLVYSFKQNLPIHYKLPDYHIANFVYGVFACIKRFKNKLQDTIRMTNSVDSDQSPHFVRPDLGPN